MRCPKCGAEKKTGAKFCGKCGALLGDILSGSARSASKPRSVRGGANRMLHGIAMGVRQ